jgi:hypothetical protein
VRKNRRGCEKGKEREAKGVKGGKKEESGDEKKQIERNMLESFLRYEIIYQNTS